MNTIECVDNVEYLDDETIEEVTGGIKQEKAVLKRPVVLSLEIPR